MRCRRSIILTTVIAAAVVSLFAAGCGGGSSTTAATTTGATPSGALAYSHCMRSHGVRNFPDPTSSGAPNKEAIVSALRAVGSSQAQAAQTACLHVNGGGPGTSQSVAQSQAQTAAMLAFARCMRTRGFADFPDPTHGQLSPEMVTAAGIDLHQPAVLNAGLACTSVTHGLLPRAAIERAVNGG
ncbi:MAG TPA: hypothetical protein VIJ33_09880 [Solirubrobacteraceae bacterium]